MYDTKFAGTGVAIITPFTSTGSVDFPALGRVVEHCIKGKVNYITVLGTTGEPVTLSKNEKAEVVNFIVKAVNKRIPIVIGCGGNNTAEVIENLKEIDTTQFAGVLSVVPYYNKPTQAGIYEHYKAIAQVSSLPIIIYNVPGRTGVNMATETTLKLARDFSNIVAVKEASGNMQQIMEIIRDKPAGFAVISGDDALTLPMIAMGASGVISVIANAYPSDFSTMVEEALGGNYQLARKIHYTLLDMITALFSEGSPSGVKAAMTVMGLIENQVRLPLVPVSERHYKKIEELVKSLK